MNYYFLILINKNIYLFDFIFKKIHNYPNLSNYILGLSAIRSKYAACLP